MVNQVGSGSVRKLLGQLLPRKQAGGAGPDDPSTLGGTQGTGQDLPGGNNGRAIGKVMNRAAASASMARADLRTLIDAQLQAASKEDGGLEKLFKAVDTDGDGKIGADELKGFIDSVLADAGATSTTGQDDGTKPLGAADTATSTAETVTRRVADTMIAAIEDRLGVGGAVAGNALALFGLLGAASAYKPNRAATATTSVSA
ncbi:EF-hand domain-containing protein [Prosthecomicrobium sp. N25]|uniref:EF-hand domain-containing protein n=1 Tax=Prosthecomicrobium sp. N25 TaxID=3129254 RepID=UPI0030788190